MVRPLVLFLSLSPKYYVDAAPGLLVYPAIVQPLEAIGRSLHLYFSLLHNSTSPYTEPFKCGSGFSSKPVFAECYVNRNIYTPSIPD